MARRVQQVSLTPKIGVRSIRLFLQAPIEECYKMISLHIVDAIFFSG